MHHERHHLSINIINGNAQYNYDQVYQNTIQLMTDRKDIPLQQFFGKNVFLNNSWRKIAIAQDFAQTFET